jgi:hypothetical protein
MHLFNAAKESWLYDVDWSIRDADNNTLAHIAANHGFLPWWDIKDKSIYKLKNGKDQTVMDLFTKWNRENSSDWD